MDKQALLGPEVDQLVAGKPYQAVRRLGRGRMGVVYVVEQPALGRQFALKVLSSKLCLDAQFADRLRLEAQAMARLAHPNIVQVVDFWITTAGFPCFVMELLDGRTLAEELDERVRLPPVEAMELVCDALSGLRVAHTAGIIHRDITLQNLYLHNEPGFGRVLKVLDFGLARVLSDASDQAPQPLVLPTRTGARVGSPGFMSPEALRGERVDHRTDIYSVGAVLYELLVGHGPYDGPASEAEPPSRHVGENIAPELDAIVLRAIREDREERYQTAEQFRSDLRTLLKLSKAGQRLSWH